MFRHLIPVALLLLLPAVARSGDEPLLPKEKQARRFFDLLRRTSPLPGDLRAPMTARPESFEEEDDDLDLLFGAPEAALVVGGPGGTLPLAGRRISVLAPVPTALSAETRTDWRAVIAGIRAGKDVAPALGRIRESTRDPRVDYLVGLVAFSGRKPAVAADAFALAAKGEGLKLPSLLLEGAAWIESGRPGKALAPLRKALTLAPEGTAPRSLLGEALTRCRRQREAAEVLAPLLAKKKCSPRIQLLHARALVLSGRAGPAIPSLDALAANGPVQYGARVVLGRAHRRQDDPAKALAALDRALALRPKALLPSSIKVQVLREAGHGEEGLTLARTLVERFPGQTRAYRTAVYAELSAGNADGALTTIQAWRKRFPKSTAARLARVRALHAAGRTGAALEELSAIEKAKPDLPAARRLREKLTEKR